MGRAKVIQSIKTNFFLFIFQVLSIPSLTELLHHTYFIWFRLIKTGLLHHNGFPRVLMATQLLAN